MACRVRVGPVGALLAVSLGACASTAVTPSASPTATAPPTPVLTRPPPAPTRTPAPTLPALSGFDPESFTAISESDFWVLGTAMCATDACPIDILHTTDSGRTFLRIPSPPTVIETNTLSAPGQRQVTDVRFADAVDGWAFGSSLWSTHDGGATWHQIGAGSILSVLQLEPGANGYVYAVVESCAVPSSATGCAFRVVRSQADSDMWSVISPPGNPAGRPQIGVHADTVWVMYFNRSTGLEWTSHDDGELWVPGSMPCAPDLGGSFDPVSTSVIWAFCATGNFGGPRLSTNGGSSYSSAPAANGSFGNGCIVAAVSAETAVIASFTTQVTTNGGATYRPVAQLSGAFWAGFTDSEVGYVLTRNQTSGGRALWRTINAGSTWGVVAFS
jgi:hypothetical protein